MDNFNDPIIQQLAKAYTNMLKEGHKHEELVKLSNEELNDLVDEYTKKVAETEGEEKEHHEKELADIKDILASRKDDKEEVKEGLIKNTLQRIKNRLMSGAGKFETDKEKKDREEEEAMIDAEEEKRKAKNKNPHRDVQREGLPDWMQRRMDKWNTEEDAKPIKEVYSLTPGREKVLKKADTGAADALHASVGSTDPEVKNRARTELGRSLRAEILRQMTKPEGKRSGAWAGTTDPELKDELKSARKSQLGESAKEIVQNINEMMKTIKGKKNGKSK
jgi:hypothetical protein